MLKMLHIMWGSAYATTAEIKMNVSIFFLKEIKVNCKQQKKLEKKISFLAIQTSFK